MQSNEKTIKAYATGAILAITDWLTVIPWIRILGLFSTKGYRLAYTDRKAVEEDIRKGAVFLTNHRDIIMDPAFLSMLLRERYCIRPFMGIGNNLFGKWWIEPFVRFNRCFVVLRGGTPRELLQHSQVLASYIHKLRARGKSIWLAQREGRAKDGNDLTQPAVLKMLTMGQDNFIEAIRALNICPVSLNYEYDPCDYLKAAEFQLKRDNPDWKKTKQDDILSMETGICGKKGRVVFRMTPSINRWLDTVDLSSLPHNAQVEAVAKQIDKQIHAAYEIYPRGTEFEAYLQNQLSKVTIPNKDITFLNEKIHEMYTNPIKNHHLACDT
ncbi:MAG: 1-acyl-sn-glycerol-3-phosphate acyltransferase [Paludibacteraceae bacterium]|nr:1-acyl-sn-glycerol-3-phosphate acyltransferase [Paludibacteraceae bacterium]